MNLNHYSLITTDFRDYEFYSEGPKGKIKKVVRYRKIEDDPITYNLAFGDENREGEINDTTITDNRDRDLVLSSVVITINKFCDHFGNHFIYAEGSTAARTRLYQMGIGKLWTEISADFDVWGYRNNSWHEFELNVNYEAFLAKRK
jgi:hypothetical protein